MNMNEKTNLRIIKVVLIVLGVFFLYRYYEYLGNPAIIISIYLAASILTMHYEPNKSRKTMGTYIDGGLILVWALIFIYKAQYWLFLAVVFLFIISNREWYLTGNGCETSLQHLKSKNKKEFVTAAAVWIVFIISIFLIS